MLDARAAQEEITISVSGDKPAAAAAAAANTDSVSPLAGRTKGLLASEHVPQSGMLELDPVNAQAPMVTVLRVLDHMQEKFGASYEPNAMPRWMADLRTRCLDNGECVFFFLCCFSFKKYIYPSSHEVANFIITLLLVAYLLPLADRLQARIRTY
jgi:hypothetical protein